MKVTASGLLKSGCQTVKKSFFMSKAIHEIHVPVALWSVSPPLPALSPGPCHGHRGQLGSVVTPRSSRRLGAPTDWVVHSAVGGRGSWRLLTAGSICSSLHVPVSAEALIRPYTSLSNWFGCKQLLFQLLNPFFFLKIASTYTF